MGAAPLGVHGSGEAEQVERCEESEPENLSEETGLAGTEVVKPLDPKRQE